MKLSLTFLSILLSLFTFSQTHCDSTATEISICQGDLPYSWNNENFTSSGIYVDTLQDVNSCDSIIVLVLTVTPTISEINNVTVCEGNLPYLWNNESYAASGLFYDSTFSLISGCDSINILNLFVIAFPTVTLNDTTICQGDFINLLASTTSLSCDLADPICVDGFTTYPNQTNTAAPSGNDYGCLSEQANPSWFYLTIDQSGSLDFTVSQTIVSGTGQDVDFILYGPYSSYNEAQSYCGNLGTETSGSTVNTIVSCSYSANETETIVADSVQSGEVYILMVTNFSNGVGNYTFAPGIGTATIDCSVVTDNSLNYDWSSGDTTSYVLTAPFETTTYTVTVSQGSCPGVEASAVVTVLLLPEVTLTDQTILTGEIAVLNSVVSPEGGTYLWLETGEITPSSAVSPTSNTSYTLEYTYNGCSTLAYVIVFVGDASLNEINERIISLFPNPAKDKLTIMSNNFTQSDVFIFSMDGREIANYKLNGTELNIDIQSLAKGMYTVSIGGKTKLFVKE